MNTKKNLLAAAIAMSMGISGFALADQGGDGDPNNNANDNSAANTNYSGNADSGNDNSTNNRHNPDPTAEVRWGDQTWEEMMLGYYRTVDGLEANDN